MIKNYDQMPQFTTTKKLVNWDENTHSNDFCEINTSALSIGCKVFLVLIFSINWYLPISSIQVEIFKIIYLILNIKLFIEFIAEEENQEKLIIGFLKWIEIFNTQEKVGNTGILFHFLFLDSICFKIK